ncbi:hypothetical protein MIND_00969800 [Mycena indigotica]|uniref:Uncharacterized protein n=1 Tax=Mycena indigotica TaxID=2126181 RepID=A0A8H6W0R9_9AGAR|nr:uncharacterized protein MIND_00969800 [Mycena indigotica]KAF7297363.1 hypothetical protein MIND_00969800 [Mycena indigotica]
MLPFLFRFATVITATIFYLYMKLRSILTCSRRKTRKIAAPTDVEGRMIVSRQDSDEEKYEIPTFHEPLEAKSAACNPNSISRQASSIHVHPFEHIIHPQTHQSLSSISNTHGQGIDQARLFSPHRHQSLKRIQPSTNLRFESCFSSPDGGRRETAPASASWYADKENKLVEVRRWSKGVQSKRMSLPIQQTTQQTSARPISAPASLDTHLVPVAPTFDQAPNLSFTVSNFVDVYTSMDRVARNESVEEYDMTMIALSDDRELSMQSDRTFAVDTPSEMMNHVGKSTSSLSQESECDSELAYLQLSASNSSLVLSDSSCDTLPFSLSLSLKLNRQSDGSLGEVLDAWEEMLQSPKWLSLVDLEGAAARREEEQRSLTFGHATNKL